MNADYHVNTQKLKDALEAIVKVGVGGRRKRKLKYACDVATFDFKGDVLDITHNSTTVGVEAKGKGKGRAFIDWKLIAGITSYVNDQDVNNQKYLKIRVEDSSFHLGRFSIDSEWMDLDQKIIDGIPSIESSTSELENDHSLKEVMAEADKKSRTIKKLEKEIELIRENVKKEKEDFLAGLSQREETIERERTLLDKTINEQKEKFPTAIKAYTDLIAYQDDLKSQHLINKKSPAKKASETVSEVKAEKKVLAHRLKYAEYQLGLISELMPTVEEIVNDGLEEKTDATNLDPKEPGHGLLTKEEWLGLSDADRDQLELDRYNKRNKSKWQIGREYERYVGYLYEQKGYRVTYPGALLGLKDAGRDVIAEGNGEVLVIQAKYWSKKKSIHEKHILQTFGTAMEMAVGIQQRNENDYENLDLFNQGSFFDLRNIRPVIYTSTSLSETARKMAEALRVIVKEEEPLKDWPQIKCNIGSDGEKIYHLPTDQQYDRTLIEPEKGEFSALTPQEAIEKGFRRAFKWRPAK